MNNHRPWGTSRIRERVQVSLRDFQVRQRAREHQRKEFQEWYQGQVLPARIQERRPLDPKRDIYPAQRSPETHVEIRRVPK
jgi:hypothetical protein